MKTKIFQIDGYEDFIEVYDIANLFTVHQEYTNENNTAKLIFNINKTISFKNTDEAPETYFDSYFPRESDAWPLISYNYYGTTRLWWLICKINNIQDPSIEPYEFGEIKILKKEHVNNILNQLRKA